MVSIIMAAYNAENTIEYAIKSVIAQTYQDWELIIINDCSKDSTLEIVNFYAQKDSRIKLINNERNAGVSITRLNGLRASKGEWIAILDSDDAWLPEKLEKQLKKQCESKADIVYTGVSYIDESGNELSFIFNVPSNISYKKLLKQNIITNSSALVKKEVFEKYYAIGDEMHEDFALWLSALKNGAIAFGIDEPLTTYRISSNSKSGNKIKSAFMNWKTYRFVKLSVISSLYYMCWYVVKGLEKYKHIRL